MLGNLPQDSSRGDLTIYHIRLGRDVYARVRRSAAKKHVSVSELIEAFCERGLACETMGGLGQREVALQLLCVFERAIRASER